MRKPYNTTQVLELKEAIRTGKPFIQIAEHFSGKWDRSFASLYSKVRSLAARTYKIREWQGPKRRVGSKAASSYEKRGFTTVPLTGKTIKSLSVYKDKVVINF